MQSVIGIDALTMQIQSRCPKTVFEVIEKRNENGNIYLKIVPKQNNNYIVTIVLPCVVSPNNLEGFTLLDSIKLELVINIIQKDLMFYLGTNDLDKLIVKKLEINANKRVSKNVDIDMLTEFVARTLLKCRTKNDEGKYISYSQQCEFVHGRQVKGTRTIKKRIIDGFKTNRDSTGRFYTKCYNKSREQNIEDKMQYWRFELIYTSYGVQQALGLKRQISLTDVLEREAIVKLIHRYVDDIKDTILPPIRLYLLEAVNLVLDDLKAGTGAYKTLLKYYDIIKYDYRIYRVAMRKYYKIVGNTRESADVQCSRIKRKALEDNIEIFEGTVKELEVLFREVRLQGM